MSAATTIPSGTVTLLFTDVEGSTRLWEAEPGAAAQAMSRHDHIMRRGIEYAGGFTFKTVGDAFCAAFATPQAALAAALAAQRTLGAESWPTASPVRVRMALHTGVCEERDNDYFGPVVNRTARLVAAAHGGQVLVSGVTAGLLSDVLPAGVALRDLGLHRLKDLGRPEQVFQVEAEFLASGFPPLGSLDNPDLPNNLPSLPSSFIGREHELDEVRSLVGQYRLVTLAGPGGSGKTRLALQAAADFLDAARDGVWFADLASVSDGEGIPGAVASALGLPDQRAQPPLGWVVAALREQDTLILLDNCEQVIDAAAKFCDEVMRSCPRVRVLATSREPLGIDGEHVYRVPSLSLPPEDCAAEDIAASDAVRLFAERARAYDSTFALDGPEVVAAVAAICRRLDGIPLAIELAAARLPAISLTQLSDRLGQRFQLLTGGSRSAVPRQRTLRATVDWSYALLTEAERVVLRRLSVFAGGHDLGAAEAVCAAGDIEVGDVLDLLASLVSKSLVVADHGAGTVRYRLLETIRQYAAEQLLKSDGEPDVLAARDRHADFYLALAEAAAPALEGSGPVPGAAALAFEGGGPVPGAAALAFEGSGPGPGAVAPAVEGSGPGPGEGVPAFEGGGPVPGAVAPAVEVSWPGPREAAAGEAAGAAAGRHGQAWWLKRLDLECENIRAAFAHLSARGRAEDVLRLGIAAKRFFLSRGQVAVLSYLRQALDSTLDRADAAPSPLLARALLETADLLVALSKEAAERAVASQYARNGLAMARLLGDSWLEAAGLAVLGTVAYFDGDRERCLQLSEQGLAIARPAGYVSLIGRLLQGTASANTSDEEFVQLRLEALACYRACGDDLYAAHELQQLYGIDIANGRIQEAREHLGQAIAIANELGDRVFWYLFRCDLVILLLMEGNYQEADRVTRRCLLMARRSGARLDVSEALLGAACCATWRGDQLRAALLHGAADVAIRSSVADGNLIRWSAGERALQEREQDKLRALIGADAFATGFRQGGGLSTLQAVDVALGQ